MWMFQKGHFVVSAQQKPEKEKIRSSSEDLE